MSGATHMMNDHTYGMKSWQVHTVQYGRDSDIMAQAHVPSLVCLMSVTILMQPVQLGATTEELPSDDRTRSGAAWADVLFDHSLQI